MRAADEPPAGPSGMGLPAVSITSPPAVPITSPPAVPSTVATSGGNVILLPAPPALSQARSLLATAPAVATGLPPVPSPAPPIFLVPVSSPDPNSLVPSTPMPLIVSVVSLSAPTSAQSGVAGATPLLPKPPSIEQLQQEVAALRQEADDLRRELAEAQHQCVRVEAALARQSERLGRFLRLDQVDSLQRDERAVRWSERTLRFALELYCSSAEVYERLLAANWPLPSKHTLRTFCRERDLREGVPPQLLQEPEQPGGAGNIVWM